MYSSYLLYFHSMSDKLHYKDNMFGNKYYHNISQGKLNSRYFEVNTLGMFHLMGKRYSCLRRLHKLHIKDHKQNSWLNYT